MEIIPEFKSITCNLLSYFINSSSRRKITEDKAKIQEKVLKLHWNRSSQSNRLVEHYYQLESDEIYEDIMTEPSKSSKQKLADFYSTSDNNLNDVKQNIKFPFNGVVKSFLNAEVLWHKSKKLNKKHEKQIKGIDIQQIVQNLFNYRVLTNIKVSLEKRNDVEFIRKLLYSEITKILDDKINFNDGTYNKENVEETEKQICNLITDKKNLTITKCQPYDNSITEHETLGSLNSKEINNHFEIDKCRGQTNYDCSKEKGDGISSKLKNCQKVNYEQVNSKQEIILRTGKIARPEPVKEKVATTQYIIFNEQTDPIDYLSEYNDVEKKFQSEIKGNFTDRDHQHEQRVAEFLTLLENLKLHGISEEIRKIEETEIPKPKKDIKLQKSVENDISYIPNSLENKINGTKEICKQTKPLEHKQSTEREHSRLRHIENKSEPVIRGSTKQLPRSPKHINLRNRKNLIPRPIQKPSYFEHQIDEEKVEELVPPPPPLNWKSYHRLHVIYNFLDELEINYPSLCSVRVIGISHEGRNIKILKVSNSNEANSPVWIDAGIHAREWIGPAVNTYVINQILKNFRSLPEYITNKDWYFLPVANPDGYEYSHTDDRMWRKNRASINGHCFGVDLNRNFSYGWGCGGSSSTPTNNFYRGSRAFSEPESQAIKNAILNSGIPFKVYLTLHSFGQKIIFPFAFREELCQNYIRLLRGAAVMSKGIFETSGKIYKVGTSKDMMYRASGTSQDWCHGVAQVPYCYLIELCDKKHKFKMPQEDIEGIGNEILHCVFKLMEFVDKHPLEEETRNADLFSSGSDG